jgi:hypothetical protein
MLHAVEAARRAFVPVGWRPGNSYPGQPAARSLELEARRASMVSMVASPQTCQGLFR